MKTSKENQSSELKGMLKTGAIHAAFALAFQIAIGLSSGDWFAGALGATMFYLGWEVTQRRYKIAEGRSQKDLKPWEGFDVIKWGKDALIDLAMPIAVVWPTYLAHRYGMF